MMARVVPPDPTNIKHQKHPNIRIPGLVLFGGQKHDKVCLPTDGISGIFCGAGWGWAGYPWERVTVNITGCWKE